MSEYVAVKCWKCGGTGKYAYGVCFGCDGTGTNTYTATAYARRLNTAKGKREAQQRRNAEAAAKRDAELAQLSFDEMLEEVRNMCNIGHDGLLEDWVPGDTERTERITPEEKARRLMSEYHA